MVPYICSVKTSAADAATEAASITNAIVVPLDSLTANVATPEGYGAAGDGITDDTFNIRAALTALGNKGGGVLFCAGRYKVSQQNDVPLNVQIVGNATPINYDLPATSPITGPSVFLQVRDDFSFFRFLGRNAISGIAFDAAVNGQAMNTGAVLELAPAMVGLKIDGVYMNRAYIGLKGSNGNIAFNDVQISNFQVMHFKRSAVELYRTCGIYMRGFVFIDRMFDAEGSVGIRGTNNVSTGFFSQGSIIGCGTPISFTGADQFVDDLHFVDIDVDHGKLGGVVMERPFNVDLERLWVGYNGSNGINVSGDSGQNLNIRDCFITNSQYSGIAVTGANIKGVRIIGNDIRGNNTANNSQGVGIFMGSGISDFNISCNTVTNTNTYPDGALLPGHQKVGIRVQSGAASDYYVIRDNIVTGNESSGVDDGGTGIHKTVTGNL